jgi:hypothetical protein
MLLLMLSAALQCAAGTDLSGSCRHGDVCACATCATDPVLGRWAGDLPDEKFDRAVWFAFSRDGGGRMHCAMFWRWGILQYPESISYSDGVFKFRQPLKGPPASLKGANRYLQRRATHFKWFFCSLDGKDRLKVEMKDLNYWGQPIDGTPVDLGSFVCTRIPAPGPAPDLERAVYGKPIDLLANGLADWEEVQKDKPLPNQWSFKDGVLSTAHKLTPQGGWVPGCNLRTKCGEYGDCRISFDFRLPEFSNSGVWLRGNYEINICDSYGWAIDNRNSGILCGLFEPLVSAEKKYGEWQHIDCWFVNRHCTIVLNGKVTMDNAPVYGVTGGAMTSDVFAKGPVVLQGDHSGCDFRNMVLTPVLSCPDALPLEPGYTRLFNGRDLDGWIGATNLFYAENGELVFREGEKNFGNLFYGRKFSDFNARFQFKLVPNGNNGFAIRAGDAAVVGGALVGGNTPGRDAAYNGMEIQILDDTGSLKQNNKSWQYCGSIYGVVAAQKGHLRPVGEWNDYDVTAQGDNVTVRLNGVTILSTSVKDLDANGGTPDGKPHPGLHNKSGYIGFLGHTMPVRMRNIRVKELTGKSKHKESTP